MLHVAQPVEDGVAMVVADLARRQVEDGWRVSVAGPSDGWLSTAVRAAGAAHVRWEAVRQPGPTIVGEVRSLARALRTVRPDVVHLHSSKAGLAGRLALRGRLPTLFSPHAWSFFHVQGVTGRAALAWERRAVRWADVVLCGSRDEMRAGLEAGVDARYRVIANSSRITAAGEDQTSARLALGLDPDVPVVVCFGRYAHQKGQDVLLAAWPEVARAVPDAVLLLVGGGPDEEELRALAPEGVRFAPGGDRTNVVRWLLAADVLAFPSRWETLSLAVLEALELGRAVVVSDCSGMTEALAGGPGTMVAREDPQALARALVRFAGDRELAAATGAAAATHYRQTHAPARATRFAEYSALLTDLVGARR